MYDESLPGAAEGSPGEEYPDPAFLPDSSALLRREIPEPRRSPEGE
ncbi:hypothetical protein [Prauserella halophila]|nr:hypothetical protein [Prauserella halophila]MCP2238488.1 hypothetical protein [Prauserella halophila]